MQVIDEVRRVLDQILSLNGRSSGFTADTALLGAIPELDSMAVVSLITALEDHFGISVDDDEVDGSVFETVGSLSDFIGAKLDAA
jgi:acyl carrier protein